MKYQPIYAGLKTAANMLDMSPKQFQALVSEGVLPKPMKIGEHERWSVESLKAIATGTPAHSYEDVIW